MDFEGYCPLLLQFTLDLLKLNGIDFVEEILFKHSLLVREGGLLINVLTREMPLLPAWAIREALRKRDIKINGVRTQENTDLKSGDRVELYTPVIEKEIPIVFENEDCIIVNKPAGLNTDDSARSSFSLLAWAKSRAMAGEKMALVHRLDNKTEGLVILSKNEKAEAEMKALFKERKLTKRYECLVMGEMPQKSAVLTAYLLKDPKEGRVRIFDRQVPGSREIITGYEVLSSGLLTRLLITLHTGRTHQIRAHLASLGHPVLGDEVYGDRGFNRLYKAAGLKLCATTLIFYEDCPLPGLRGKRFEIRPSF